MGINTRRRKGATNSEIDKCASGFEAAAEFLRRIANLADALAESLAEVARFRRDLSQSGRSLDYRSMVAEIEGQDAILGHALNSLTMQTFKLGRLTGAADGVNWLMLNGRKIGLEKILSDQFGVPFSVTIRHKKCQD